MSIEIGKLSIKSSVGEGQGRDKDENKGKPKAKDKDKDKDDGECCGKPGARNQDSRAGAWHADARRQAQQLHELQSER